MKPLDSAGLQLIPFDNNACRAADEDVAMIAKEKAKEVNQKHHRSSGSDCPSRCL